MVGSSWAPREVHFAHKAPGEISEHGRRYFLVAPATLFVMDRRFCEKPIPAADSNLFKILSRYLDDVLNRMPREDEILTPIRKIIAQLMKDGGHKLALAAKTLGVSPSHFTAAAKKSWNRIQRTGRGDPAQVCLGLLERSRQYADRDRLFVGLFRSQRVQTLDRHNTNGIPAQ
jgi:hypothetical protein